MENAVHPERIGNLIISEIRRLQAQSKRADFTSVVHAAECRLCLNNSESNFYLKQMVTNGKIKVVSRGGAESFRIIDKDIKIENSQNDRTPKRKASNDEGKSLECSNSLIQEAVTIEQSQKHTRT